MHRFQNTLSVLARILLVILGILVITAFLLSIPPNPNGLVSHPDPAASYSESVNRIAAMLAEESHGYNPDCKVQFMAHQHKSERVIVFIHGYTQCPAQFQKLAEEFFRLGYNVLIAPMPHHGLENRMTSDQQRLTAVELAAYANSVVDIAQGLGEEVTVAGLSGGGVITAWAAQQRKDIDLAVVISPGFGYYEIPTALTVPAMNLFRVLPNFYRWWYPDLKESAGPIYSYPRYATRALAELLVLSAATQALACRGKPPTAAILVITNANDRDVNNELTTRVVQCWRKQGVKDLRTFEFEPNLKLIHDFIDPWQEEQQIEIVYPRLIELITK